jgi:hypothetical protein
MNMSNDKNGTNRAALLATLALVRPALATQAYLPALTHIRFAEGWATAYNDVSAIMVRADLGFDCCIPGDRLIRALGSFSGEQVMVQQGADGAVVVSSGRAKVKLPTLKDQDFPFELPGDDAPEVGLENQILKGITRCLISVGKDDKHPAQLGVTLDADDRGCAVLFSTDSTTISRYQTKAKVKLPADSPVILPTFFCEQLVGLSKAFPEEHITLVLLPGALLVEFGKKARLFTKTLVDLEPLDFPRVIARHCKLAGLKEDLSAIPDAFEAALGRSLLVLGDEVAKATRITCGDGVLRLHSTCGMGDADDSLPYELTGVEPTTPFYIDPALLARASKVCALVGFLERVVVLADEQADFVHLIAHSAPPAKHDDK